MRPYRPRLRKKRRTVHGRRRRTCLSAGSLICDWSKYWTPWAMPFRLPDPPRQTKFDPFFIRLPLFSPQRFLDACLPWTSFLFTARAAVIVGIVAAALTALVAADLRNCANRRQEIFLPRRATVVAPLLARLKSDPRNGSRPRMSQISAATFARRGFRSCSSPRRLYVDVTSVWRFPSRWQRLPSRQRDVRRVACGHGLFRVLLLCESPAVRQVCANVILWRPSAR